MITRNLKLSTTSDRLRSRTRAAGIAGAMLALALALAGCGGSAPDSQSAPPLQPQGMEVVGADGAAVSLTLGQAGVTVRVARDATGAPPLATMQQPAGAIYQFSPLGLAVGEAEIRVPFDAAQAGANPQLAVAQPGGLWTVVSAARQEGGFLVARVPQLSFAVALAGDAAPPMATGTARVQSAAPARPRLTVTPITPITQTIPPWNLLAVQQPQTLAFDVELRDAAACAGPYSVEMRAVVIRPTRTPGALFGWLQIVPIGTQAIAGSAGTVSFARPFSTADNGNWFFTATATCRRAAAQPVPVAYLAVAPRGYTVNIAAGDLPVIATQPADASVIEGDSASFSASASGSTGVQWERSNDGGATYAAVVGATGGTLTFATTLADNGALVRLRATNATGSVFSNAARLAVAERVIAPTISVDPVDQSVIEGETASFTVAGSGKPVPTVQWQQRAGATGAWGDIPGATASTYTTPPLPLSDSGAQIRALLTNRGGQAASLVATLTVRPRIVAPAITTGPQDATAPVGTRASFSVTATGTAPLSYRWLRNGSASGISDLGSSAFVDVVAADLGQPITVTVEVSNAAGTVRASATLTATPAPNGATVPQGGGKVTSPDNRVQITFPAGALTADSRVIFTPITPFALPATPAFEDAALISGTTYQIDITGGTLNGNVPLRFTIAPPATPAVATGARSVKAAAERPLGTPSTEPQTSVFRCPDGTTVILNDASGEGSYDSGTGLQCSQDGVNQVQIGLGLVVSPATRVSYAMGAAGNQKVLSGLGGASGRMSYLYETDPTPNDSTTIKNFGIAVVQANGSVATMRLASSAGSQPPQLLAFDGVGSVIVREFSLQTASPFLVTTCTVSKYTATISNQLSGFARSWSVQCPVLARVPRAISFSETQLLRIAASTNGAEVVLAAGDGYLDWLSFASGAVLRTAVPLRPTPVSQPGTGTSPAFNLIDMVIDATGAVWIAEFGGAFDVTGCSTFEKRCVAVSKIDRFGTFIAQNTDVKNGYPFTSSGGNAQSRQARLRLAPAGVTYAYSSVQVLPFGGQVDGPARVVTLAAADARLLAAGTVTGSEVLFVDDLVVDAAGQSLVLLDRSAFNPANTYGKFVARVAANGSLVGITQVPGSGFVRDASVRSPIAIDVLGQVSSVYITSNGTSQSGGFGFPVWQANLTKFTP